MVVRTTPTNVHDSQPAIEMLDAIPPLPGPRGRPRHRPRVLLSERAYGSCQNRAACRARKVKPLLGAPGEPHGSWLGIYRYLAE